MTTTTTSGMRCPEVTLAGRRLGRGHAPLVIAEIGVNHDGDLATALSLVRSAGQAGADAVKLQLFRADALVHESSAFAGYQRLRCDDAGPAAMLRRYELSPAAAAAVVAATRAAGMIPLATPFSPADVPLVRSLDLPAVKIASPDLVNRPLLAAVAALGRPVLVSTGAATVDEIARTMEWLAGWDVPAVLLHCVSSYPVPDDAANLCWIAELATRFGVPVGYSDHTTDPAAGALAVAAGACVIEKHLTHDRAAPGPDHAASADAVQFADYVRQIRRAATSCGSPGKRVLAIEEEVRRVSRQSVVLTRRVDARELLREADLTVQRPGTGIPAADLMALIGRRVSGDLAAGTMLTWDMVAGPD